MDCEFEEKQFEQHLNFELLSKHNLLYVPGQVLENTLGFDSALFTVSHGFWRHFPFTFAPPVVFRSGIRIHRSWWRSLDNRIDYFPKFKCNVFIQHKRPTHLTTANSKEWSHWKREYFRFGLTPHQQSSLENLEDKIGKKGVVVYASPAFSKLKKLWEAVSDRTIVDKTNFVQPTKLKGHNAYTYVEPGNKGRAYSDPEDIEGVNVFDHIARLSETVDMRETNRTFIITTGNIIDSVMAEDETAQGFYRDIVSVASEGLDIEIALAIVKIDAFCFLKKTSWQVAT